MSPHITPAQYHSLLRRQGRRKGSSKTPRKSLPAAPERKNASDSGLRLRLPFPPSVNAAYRNVPGKGRVKTRTCLAWEKAARAAAAAYEPMGMIRGPYEMRLSVKRPDARRRDVENLIKTTSDLLVSLGLVEDDSMAESVTASWRTWGEPGVEIEITAATAEKLDFALTEKMLRAGVAALWGHTIPPDTTSEQCVADVFRAMVAEIDLRCAKLPRETVS